MFTCKDSIDLLRAFLDGEMTPRGGAAPRGAPRRCPPCVDFVQTYRATPGLCRKALKAKMPEELSEKLTEFLRGKTQPDVNLKNLSLQELRAALGLPWPPPPRC